MCNLFWLCSYRQHSLWLILTLRKLTNTPACLKDFLSLVYPSFSYVAISTISEPGPGGPHASLPLFSTSTKPLNMWQRGDWNKPKVVSGPQSLCNWILPCLCYHTKAEQWKQKNIDTYSAHQTTNRESGSVWNKQKFCEEHLLEQVTKVVYTCFFNFFPPIS